MPPHDPLPHEHLPHEHGAELPGNASFAENDRALLRALEAEGLYAFPPSLAARIVAEALGAPRRTLLDVAVRCAAGVVLALAAWSALLGHAPEFTPRSALPEWTRPPVAFPSTGLPSADLLEQAPSLPGGLAPWLAGVALLLLASTPFWVRRVLRRTGQNHPTSAGGAPA